ncbi:MAG: AAA family ATPase [Chloroflexi bacterium]|nr:AAA family ATPase [Chloroflexota bacterium]
MSGTHDLVERDEQLSVLAEAISSVAAGRGKMVFVSGEAGIGKTSLVRCFTEELIGVQVATGMCDPLPIATALGPLRDIALDLGPPFEQVLAANHSGPDLFGAIASILASRTAPIVLVFEDVHWADQASLEFLGYIGRRIERFRVLVIATFRADESSPDGPLAMLLGNLVTASGIARIALRPLSRAAVTRLSGPSHANVEELYRRTGGNPFFVNEMLSAPALHVPATISQAVLARVARRSSEAQHALEVAALLGGRIDPLLLARLIEADGIPRWAMQEAISAGFLEQQGQSVGFRHDLVQAAIAEAVPAERTQRLHTSILEELRRRISGPGDFAIAARHAEAAGDDHAVLEFAPRAANRASALGAHREAAQLLSAALARTAHQPRLRAELVEARAVQNYLSRRFADAARDHQLAADLRREQADHAGEARNLIHLAYVTLASGDRTQSEATLQRATELVESLPPCRERAMAYEAWSRRLFMSNQPVEAQQWAQRAVAVADAIVEPELALEARITASVSRLLAAEAGAQHELEELRERARQHSHTTPYLQDAFARATFYLALVPMVHRDYANVDRYIDEGWQHASDHQLEYWENLMTAVRALRSLDAGRWQDAAQAAQQVLDLAESAWRAKLVASIVLARVRTRTGDAEAGAAVRLAEDIAAHDPPLEPMLWLVQAEAAWLSGDAPKLSAITRTAESTNRRLDPWWRDELEFWNYMAGLRVDAQAAEAEPFRLAIGGAPIDAAAWWQRRGCPYEMAVTLIRADDAAEVRRAIAVLDQLGATPAGVRARQRLRELGVRSLPRGPRPSTSANPAGLTSREQEVLELVAAGLKNAEIGQRLFLSEKTVERHLAGIFLKLDVASRDEAVRAATRLGALAPRQFGGRSSPI